jgi:hypothetical protein
MSTNFQANPGISEVSGVIGNQCDPAIIVFPVKPREKAQIDQALKPVTDSDHEFSLLNETMKLLAHVIFYLQGEKYPCSVIVSPAKAAAKDEDMVLREQ